MIAGAIGLSLREFDFDVSRRPLARSEQFAVFQDAHALSAGRGDGGVVDVRGQRLQAIERLGAIRSA